MKFIKILPLLLGFCLDLLIGDPHEIPHPAVWIGRLIAFLEKKLRAVFPKTAEGEKAAGFMLWMIVTAVSAATPWGILYICGRISL